jgi:alkyl sulfatase BDS1-like metallo-beta-lactamase superfamily hydrolase
MGKRVINDAYYNAPNNVARQAYADSLRKLGQESEGLIARNFYLAGVKSLESEDPEVGLTESPSAAWVASAPETAINYLRTRLNPNKAKGVTGKLGFIVDGKSMQLEIRIVLLSFLPQLLMMLK